MVVPLPDGKSIGKPITKLCIIAAQDQRFARYAARKASIFPHHPSVVQKIKNMSLFVCPCACSIWFPFSLHSVPRAAFVPHASPWYCIALHSNHTLQHLTASGYWLSIICLYRSSYSPLGVRGYSPSPFPAHFQWYVFRFCDEFAPLIA